MEKRAVIEPGRTPTSDLEEDLQQAPSQLKRDDELAKLENDRAWQIVKRAAEGMPSEPSKGE